MYIDSPIWRLKQICPFCEQGGLELFTCNDCTKVSAICGELNTAFPDPLNINLENATFENQNACSHCGTVGKLRHAKDYEIGAIGLTTLDYE